MHKRWDYSISDVAKYSGISFKTALTEVKKIAIQDVVTQTRTVGNATMYQFNMDSKQAHYIDKIINEIATRRIREALESKQIMKIKQKKKKQR